MWCSRCFLLLMWVELVLGLKVVLVCVVFLVLRVSNLIGWVLLMVLFVFKWLVSSIFLMRVFSLVMLMLILCWSCWCCVGVVFLSIVKVIFSCVSGECSLWLVLVSRFWCECSRVLMWLVVWLKLVVNVVILLWLLLLMWWLSWLVLNCLILCLSVLSCCVSWCIMGKVLMVMLIKSSISMMVKVDMVGVFGEIGWCS